MIALWLTLGAMPRQRISREEKGRGGSRYNISSLCQLTLIQACVSLLFDDSLQTTIQALLWSVLSSDVHAALDCDIRICNCSRHYLANRPKVEGVGWCYAPSTFYKVLQLLKDSVLQDGIDYQDESRKHACK